MKKILFILLCSMSLMGHAAISNNKTTCAEINKQADEIRNKLPLIIDDVTTGINYIVNCESKIITHEKQIFIDIKTVSKDRIITLLKRFIVSQCTNGYAKRGWVIKELYYNKNMKHVLTFIAKPENCAK